MGGSVLLSAEAEVSAVLPSLIDTSAVARGSACVHSSAVSSLCGINSAPERLCTDGDSHRALLPGQAAGLSGVAKPVPLETQLHFSSVAAHVERDASPVSVLSAKEQGAADDGLCAAESGVASSSPSPQPPENTSFPVPCEAAAQAGLSDAREGSEEGQDEAARASVGRAGDGGQRVLSVFPSQRDAPPSSRARALTSSPSQPVQSFVAAARDGGCLERSAKAAAAKVAAAAVASPSLATGDHSATAALIHCSRLESAAPEAAVLDPAPDAQVAECRVAASLPDCQSRGRSGPTTAAPDDKGEAQPDGDAVDDAKPSAAAQPVSLAALNDSRSSGGEALFSRSLRSSSTLALSASSDSQPSLSFDAAEVRACGEADSHGALTQKTLYPRQQLETGASAQTPAASELSSQLPLPNVGPLPAVSGVQPAEDGSGEEAAVGAVYIHRRRRRGPRPSRCRGRGGPPRQQQRFENLAEVADGLESATAQAGSVRREREAAPPSAFRGKPHRRVRRRGVKLTSDVLRSLEARSKAETAAGAELPGGADLAFFWMVKQCAAERSGPEKPARSEGREGEEDARERAGAAASQDFSGLCERAASCGEEEGGSRESSEVSTKGTVNHRCREEGARVNLCDNPSDLWFGLKTQDGRPVVLHAKQRSRASRRARLARRQQNLEATTGTLGALQSQGLPPPPPPPPSLGPLPGRLSAAAAIASGGPSCFFQSAPLFPALEAAPPGPGLGVPPPRRAQPPRLRGSAVQQPRQTQPHAAKEGGGASRRPLKKRRSSSALPPMALPPPQTLASRSSASFFEASAAAAAAAAASLSGGAATGLGGQGQSVFGTAQQQPQPHCPTGGRRPRERKRDRSSSLGGGAVAALAAAGGAGVGGIAGGVCSSTGNQLHSLSLSHSHPLFKLQADAAAGGVHAGLFAPGEGRQRAGVCGASSAALHAHDRRGGGGRRHSVAAQHFGLASNGGRHAATLVAPQAGGLGGGQRRAAAGFRSQQQAIQTSGVGAAARGEGGGACEASAVSCAPVAVDGFQRPSPLPRFRLRVARGGCRAGGAQGGIGGGRLAASAVQPQHQHQNQHQQQQPQTAAAAPPSSPLHLTAEGGGYGARPVPSYGDLEENSRRNNASALTATAVPWMGGELLAAGAAFYQQQQSSAEGGGCPLSRSSTPRMSPRERVQWQLAKSRGMIG